MVVAVGATSVLLIRSTLPIPWFMTTDVASETLQLNSELPPALILDGLAVNKLITGAEGGGGAGAPAIVTVTDRLMLPAALIAVRV